jgi:hypothetical protein
MDQVQGVALEEAADQVLSRDFTVTLTTDEVAFLHRFLDILQRESNQVRGTMTNFSRSLRRLVETRAYQEHRRLAESIRQAQSALLQVVKTQRLTQSAGYSLAASSVPLRSIGSWRLHNPADTRSTRPVLQRPTVQLDLERLRQLVRASEIDFAELRESVSDSVRRRGAATVAEVLTDHPATQGLASVIGLLWLAHDQARPVFGVEDINWISQSGQPKTVSVARYLFEEPITEGKPS